jgi:hypothetical protein
VKVGLVTSGKHLQVLSIAVRLACTILLDSATPKYRANLGAAQLRT